jgi:hypothetical protein
LLRVTSGDTEKQEEANLGTNYIIRATFLTVLDVENTQGDPEMAFPSQRTLEGKDWKIITGSHRGRGKSVHTELCSGLSNWMPPANGLSHEA